VPISIIAEDEYCDTTALVSLGAQSPEVLAFTVTSPFDIESATQAVRTRINDKSSPFSVFFGFNRVQYWCQLTADKDIPVQSGEIDTLKYFIIREILGNLNDRVEKELSPGITVCCTMKRRHQGWLVSQNGRLMPKNFQTAEDSLELYSLDLWVKSNQEDVLRIIGHEWLSDLVPKEF
jgi:hypothetical protein